MLKFYSDMYYFRYIYSDRYIQKKIKNINK